MTGHVTCALGVIQRSLGKKQRGQKGNTVLVFIGLGEWKVLNVACDHPYWSTGWNGLGSGDPYASPQLSDFHRGVYLLQNTVSVASFPYSDSQGPLNSYYVFWVFK